MFPIIADSRESRSGLHLALESLGAQVEVKELPCGDYILAEGLVVERKAAIDFVVSIMDARIFNQVQVMKATYTKVVILVEGDIYNTRSNITQEALLGAMSYLSIIEDVQVVQALNVLQTAKLMMTMQRHAVEGLGYELALRVGKPKDRVAQANYIIQGLPGVGPGSAKKLLAHFGSAENVIKATADELRAVPGLGPKTALSIRETLEYKVG